MSRHDDLIRLRHMRDHAREAVAMAGGYTLEGMRSNRMLQLALTHLIGIIGEAAGKVSSQTTSAIPSIPWKEITGTRHRIVHGYDRVDLHLLWNTIEKDLPPLIEALERAIKALEEQRRTGDEG